ncbi:phospholipid scramblase 2-like [Bicyclus anynana]|uniref:Phospholipid scramblase n=1 Tax=Bicyclus anynana TaxID=110368 RepID=A0A6J1NDE2_BICAN|nr:phospholipid scramblase 2-like [Bicyclus anynana]
MKNIISNGVKKEDWMPCPKDEVNYPGLAYLCPLGELIVAEEPDTLHSLIGLKDISYTIYNNEGQKVFLAVKKGQYKFVIKIYNYYGNEIIEVQKPSECVNKALIWAPPGNFVGSVEKTKSCPKTYLVKNHLGEKVLKIKARQYLNNSGFNIFSNGDLIGLISARWRYAVSFPIEMDFAIKSILLGACFLISWKKPLLGS